jgi:hypothetical protein
VDGALAEPGGAGGRAKGVCHGVASRFMEPFRQTCHEVPKENLPSEKRPDNASLTK